MNKKMKVLIAYENDGDAVHLAGQLRENGYDVFLAASLRQVELLAYSHCPDILILGLRLEDAEGTAVLKSIRIWSCMPVIVFSDHDSESLMLDALDNGADDYMLKPFSTAQLISRMKVAMRHYITSNNFRGSGGRYSIGDLVIDCDECRVLLEGRDVHLTQSEFRIVALLAKHHGSVCTYEYLLSQLWGPNVSHNNEILRVNVTKIRKKLNDTPSHPRYIFTQPGVGYRMADC